MIVCCGEALIDMVPFKSGESSENDAFKPCPGGSPYNSAVAIGRLKVPVAFLGRLSTDFFGDALVARLKANGVRTDLIARTNQTTTLAFVKLAPGEEPQYAFYTEGSADRSLSPSDLPAMLPDDARCILFGSISMTMEPVASTIEALVKRESARRVVSLDPNVRPAMIADKAAYAKRLEGWIRSSTIVKISGADMEFVYPSMTRDQAMDHVLSMGPSLVVTTLGKDGALAIGKRSDGTLFRATAPIVDVKVVDTIGAGDTFHAGFLSWLELHGKMSRQAIAALAEKELSEALFFANKAASLVCAKRGAEPPTLAEMEAFKA
jgi:fructokinase